MAFVTSGTIGTSLAAVNSTQQFELGKCVAGTDGGQYLYVQANGAVAIYDCVAIDENFQAVPADSGTIDSFSVIGFAQLAFADDDFGFVAIQGTNINCKGETGTAADKAVYVDSRTSLAGQLTDATSLGTLLLGVSFVAACGTSTGGYNEVRVQSVVPFVAA